MYLMVDFVSHEGEQCISWLTSCITREGSLSHSWLRVSRGRAVYLMVDFVSHEGGQLTSWLTSCLMREGSVSHG